MLDKNDLITVMNECRVELVGVSDAQLKSTMYEVMDEFFRDTMSWKEQIIFNVAPPATQPATDQQLVTALSYPIAPAEGQIIQLDGVINNNGGGFVAALMPDPGTIQLSSLPNQAAQYVACVSKNVSLPLTRDGFPIAPSWMLQKWHLAIKAGILGNLMNQKNKSFSNTPGAEYWLKKFRQFIQNVRSATLRANTQGAGAWRFPQAFRSYSQKGGVPVYSTGNERSG
jgi:hypothetical protein